MCIRDRKKSDPWSIDILADARAAKEAPATGRTLKELQSWGADVRLVSGGEMSSLYGNRKEYYGIHHIKALLLSSITEETLWLGSCNFTQASEFNHEAMVKMTQRRQNARDVQHDVFVQYSRQFKELFSCAVQLPSLHEASSSLLSRKPLQLETVNGPANRGPTCLLYTSPSPRDS